MSWLLLTSKSWRFVSPVSDGMLPLSWLLLTMNCDRFVSLVIDGMLPVKLLESRET